jgi:hypothetical protein
MIGFKPQAEAGALMEYGVNLLELYFRSAAFIDKILKDTPPANLPIERRQIRSCGEPEDS